MNPNEIICNRLIDNIINLSKINFYFIREYLYDIFIYNLDIQECIWFIVTNLINMQKIQAKDMPDILLKTYTFLQYYNNNYRPIYHVENYILYLIAKIHMLSL